MNTHNICFFFFFFFFFFVVFFVCLFVFLTEKYRVLDYKQWLWLEVYICPKRQITHPRTYAPCEDSDQPAHS